VEKLKTQHPTEVDEKAKREREKTKLNNLQDEVAKLKQKVFDLSYEGFQVNLLNTTIE
jgi:hypothetical protein